MSSDSSEREQSPSPAKSPLAPATIARPPHTAAPPPPLVMTPWLGGPSASWQQLNTFQPWLSADADKQQTQGFSGFPPGHQGQGHPMSAFQRPGHGHGPREFLTPGHRPGHYDPRLQTQILRAEPEPGEVTIEKVEQPWVVPPTLTSSALPPSSTGASRPPPPATTATATSLR